MARVSTVASILETVSDHMEFRPLPAPDLTGTECFKGLGSSVSDFWSYAAGDLRSNTIRGVLAEWLVVKAVGATEFQPDWHDFDVLTPSGVRIEVKSSAYIQAWRQRRLSTIIFSGLSSQKWDPETGYAGRRTFNADVYVFCVQTARSHESYDPLDVSQWDFYVLPLSRVQSIGQRAIGLTRIAKEVQPVGFDSLSAAIEQAAVASIRNEEHPR